MKVSILVPIYGVERFIGECAASLFGQTYGDLEFIFVDDCTPDGSVAVLEKTLEQYPYRRSQVSIIRNARNRGSGATRSIALAAATGDFVFYADSDDVLEADAIERLVEAQQQTGADIIDGAYRRLYPDGSLSEPVLPFRGTAGSMARVMLAQNTITHNVWARLIRRSLHTDNAVDFIDGINMAEDYCIMPRLLFFATRAYIDNVVYLYRDNPSGTFSMWLNDRHIVSYLRASLELGEFLRTHDRDRRYTYAYELGMLNTIHRALGVTDMATISEHCPYHPSLPLFRVLKVLLCHRATRPLLRAAYLVVKRIFVQRTMTKEQNRLLSNETRNLQNYS